MTGAMSAVEHDVPPAPATLPDGMLIAFMPECPDGRWVLLQEDATVVDLVDGAVSYRQLSAHDFYRDARAAAVALQPGLAGS